MHATAAHSMAPTTTAKADAGYGYCVPKRTL